MRCEEDEEEKCYQIHIVSHLHHVVASAEQELVHDSPEQLEQTIGVHESGELKGIEREVFALISD